MRIILLLFLFNIINTKVYSIICNDQDSLKKPFLNGSEKMPEPKEGIAKFMKYVSANIRYPQNVLLGDVSGTVFVKFIVETDGAITDIQILKGIPDCQECQDEAIRVLKQYPNKWIPGSQNGQPFRVYFTMPIKFKPGY